MTSLGYSQLNYFVWGWGLYFIYYLVVFIEIIILFLNIYTVFNARFRREASVASNAIQTTDQITCLIICCLNCIQCDGGLTSKYLHWTQQKLKVKPVPSHENMNMIQYAMIICLLSKLSLLFQTRKVRIFFKQTS